MLLQYIEFSGADIDNDADATFTEYAGEDDDDFSSVNGRSMTSIRLPNPNADKARHHGRPLEGLLMSKNRKLQDQMTKLRVRKLSIAARSLAYCVLQVANEEATHALQSTRSELEQLTVRFDEQKRLSEKLENDLLRINTADPRSSTPKPASSIGAPLSVPNNANDSLAALVGKRMVGGASRRQPVDS